jgi:dipeptidyl aminopeptidase/acylaminoacyl peptidase
MHGWGGNAGQMLPFAALLHRAGFAALLLDARNHGSSDSDTFSSMPRFAEDLERGLDWLSRQPRIDPHRLFLLGHSVGAGAALLVASRRHEPAGVISIAAFAHPAELMRRQMRSHHIPYLPFGWLVLRYIERTIRADFDEIAPCNTIRLTACPVLLVHGKQDNRVPVADALRIYHNRRDDGVELLLLPDAAHDSGEAIEPYGDSLVSFLGRCGAFGPP